MNARAPRPLPLHLLNALAAWGGAPAAAAAFVKGLLPTAPGLEAELEALRAQLPQGTEAAFLSAVAARAGVRLGHHLEGIRAYQKHPFQREDAPHQVVWQAGSVRLLAYATEGAPVLLVPSLVNPAYVFDLMPGHSLVSYLSDRGFAPVLLDWGAPSGEELGFDGDAYVMNRLLPALAEVGREGPVPVVGYCMGGTLALAAATLKGEAISRLALLAAPWDFRADPCHAAPRLAPYLLPRIEALAPDMPMPVDWMQAFFAALDPTLYDRKYRRFAAMDQDSDDARFFVAMEDWANGGPPLARGVALMCMRDWYRDNLTARGDWQIGGARIRPEALPHEMLVIAPEGDRLVPGPVSAAVAEKAPNAVRLDPQAGHVGMVVGRRAKTALWAPLADWLAA